MGFDNECILNIQSLAGEYFCPVCRLLVFPNEALQSQCTHLYCKPCLTYVVSTTQACPYDGYLVTETDSKPLTESNKGLAETIGKIAVRCLYHRSGCTWQGPLSESTSHCSGCAFGNSVVVCNRCSVQIVHRQVQEHAQNCSGVPQAQGGKDVTVTGAAVDQTKTATQTTAAASQIQTPTQSTTQTAGPNVAQPVNPTSGAQPVIQAAMPTQEQWYQQQYQQYYQNYPGYDPYQQQYQQYYPYQQTSGPQYQQQPQGYVQGQSIPQPPLQPQAQTQTQTQTQSHPQFQQPLASQAPIAAQPQSQASVVNSHNSTGQSFPQGQPNPVQSYPQHLPLPQHQHPQPNIPNFQSQQHPVPQPPANSQTQPQTQVYHHPHPQQQPQAHPFSQPQPQPQPQHLPPPPPLPQPLSNQSLQAQPQHPIHAVTGYQSYAQQQSHPQGHMGIQQNHLQVGPHAQSHHPTQVFGQIPQQNPMVRPPQSHATMPNQQLPALLSSSGQHPSTHLAQLSLHPHPQQQGLSAPQRPPMQSSQQPMSHPPVQQQNHTSRPPFGTVQNQIHQQGPYGVQQLPVQSHIRSQGPPFQQQTHPPQNLTGKSLMPTYGAQSLPYPQSSVSMQVATAQLGPNQQPTQNLGISDPAHALTSKSEKSAKQIDATLVKSDGHLESASPVQRTVKKEPCDLDSKLGIGGGAVDTKAMNLEPDRSMDDASNVVNSASNAAESGEPVIKHPVKEDDYKKDNSTFEKRKSDHVAAEGKKIQDSQLLDETSRVFSKDKAIAPHQGPPQNAGVDAYRGVTSHGLVQAGSQLPDQGRLHPPPTHYGPYAIQERGAAPSLFPAPGPSAQLPGYPSSQSRPMGSGPIPRPGHHHKLNSLPPDTGRGMIGRVEFEEDLMKFPRPSRLDSEFPPSFRSHIASSSSLDRALLPGFGMDLAQGPRIHPDFVESAPGFAFNRMDGLPPRSSFREYPGGLPGMDDIDGRESLRFADPRVHPFHENRFQGLHGHFRREPEFENSGNMRLAEHFGHDSFSGFSRRDGLLNSHKFPDRLGEPVGFGTFPAHERMEFPGHGNIPRPRLGEPGFRSSYFLQGEMEPFDSSRKRKPSSVGWCRICKFDCVTVEGLDMHAQTREHQKAAMDIVAIIKKNAKKQKTDHSTFNDASKSRNPGVEGRRRPSINIKSY